MTPTSDPILDPVGFTRQTPMTWRCPECGSDRVQTEAWAYLNSYELVDLVECGESFCDACEQHFKYPLAPGETTC